MITEYLRERAKWKKFGKPLRSKEEMERLFIICNDCENYEKGSEDAGSCKICDCNIKKASLFLNKLAWGTTRCPLENARWVESREMYRPNLPISEQDLQIAEQDHQEELVNQASGSAPPKRCCGG